MNTVKLRNFMGFVVLFMAALSPSLYLLKPITSLFWNFQLIEWIQLILVLLISSRFIKVPTLSWILVAYLVSRFLLFQTTPIFEDDYFRYLWDGQLLTKGFNPYLLSPADDFWQKAGALISSEWRQHINFPDIRTIYPPMSLLYFSIVYKIFGESVLGLRIFAVILEVFMMIILLKLIKKEKWNLKPLCIFLFFPTLMKENINSVHFDLLATVFLMTSWLYFKNNFLSWMTLAGAVLVKIFPLILVPLYFKESKSKISSVFVFSSCIILAYLPFYSAGALLFQGAGAFAKNWIFFESSAYYLNWIFELMGIAQAQFLTRLSLGLLMLIGGLIIGFTDRIKLQNKVVVLFLMLYLLSPVLNSWYWLWSLPFLILYAPRWTWIFPVFTALGYSWFENETLYTKLHFPIYGFFLIAAIIFILKNDRDDSLRWKNESPIGIF